jgi:hypothetical protein
MAMVHTGKTYSRMKHKMEKKVCGSRRQEKKGNKNGVLAPPLATFFTPESWLTNLRILYIFLFVPLEQVFSSHCQITDIY